MHAAIQILFVGGKRALGCFQLHQWKTEAIRQLFNWRINLKSSSTAIAQIYGNKFAVNNKLEVYIEPVQQQEGEMDCGVFSIANAYNAAHAKSTKQCKMRSHIQHCFEAKTFSPFPPSQNSVAINRCDPRQIIIELYCTCGLPETMIECTECQKSGFTLNA